MAANGYLARFLMVMTVEQKHGLNSRRRGRMHRNIAVYPNSLGRCRPGKECEHNANMLNASFGAIGIGRAYDPNSQYGWY